MPETFDKLGAQLAGINAGANVPQTEREIWAFLEAPASTNGRNQAGAGAQSVSQGVPVPMDIGSDADAIGRWLDAKPQAPIPMYIGTANADLAMPPEDPLAPLSGPVAPLAFDPELENQTASGGPFTDDPAAYLYAPLPEPNVEAVNAINELRATVSRSRAKASEPDRAAVREYRTEFEARREGKAGVITRAGHATSELFRGIANAPMRMFLTGLTSEILTEEVRFRIENGLFDGSEVVANKSKEALITSRHDVSEMRRRLKNDLMDGLPMLAPQNADKQAMLYTELAKIEPKVLPAARGVFEKVAQFGGDFAPFIAEIAVARRVLRGIPGLRKMEPGPRGRPTVDPKRLIAGGPATAPALDAAGRAMVTEAGAFGTVTGLHGGDPLEGAALGAVLSGAGSAARGAQVLGKGPRAGNISQAVASGAVIGGHARASGADWTDTIIAGVVAPLLLFAGDLRRAPFRPATADPRFPDHVDGLRGHDTKVGRLIHAATRTKNNNPEGLTPEQVKQAAEILSELAEQSKPKISADEKLLLDHFRKYYAPSRVRGRVKVVARAAATKRAEKPADKPAVPAETKVAVVPPSAAPTQTSEPSAGVSRPPPTTSAPPSIPRPDPAPVRKRDPNKPRYEVVPDGERWTVFDVDTGQTTAAVGSELIAQTIADEYNAAEAVTKGEPIKPPSIPVPMDIGIGTAPERPKPPARPQRKPGFLAAPKAAEVSEDALPDWEARIRRLPETERKAYERAYGPALNNPETMAGQVAQLSHQLSTAVRQEQRTDLIDTLKNQLAFLLHMQFKGEIPGATGVPTPVPEKKSEPPHIPPGVSPDVHREQELISGKPKKTFTQQRDADQQRNFIEEQYDAGKLPDAIASELGLKLGAVSDVVRNLVQRRRAQELRGELPSDVAVPKYIGTRKTQTFGQFVGSQGHDISELDASTSLYRQLKQDYDESQGNALPVGDVWADAGSKPATPDERLAQRFEKSLTGRESKIGELRGSTALTNTRKRLQEAGQRDSDATRLEREVRLLRAAADLARGGRMPAALSGVRSTKDFLMLDSYSRREGKSGDYPTGSFHYSVLRDFAERLAKYRNKENKWLTRLAHVIANEDLYYPTGADQDRLWKLTGVATATAKTKADDQLKWDARRLRERLEDAQAARGMGLMDSDAWEAAKQAVKDIAGRSKGEVAADVVRQRLEREFNAGGRPAGFFETPRPLAERMVDMAEIGPGARVWEPEAGIGAIADVIREKHPGAELILNEVSPRAAEVLKAKGHGRVSTASMLNMRVGGPATVPGTGKPFDAIVMNPPFEKGADIDHVRHAYDQLSPGGWLVAVMGRGPFSRSDTKATDFRDWLQNVGGEFQELPEGTFKASGTGVATNLVWIRQDRKPLNAAPGTPETPGPVVPTVSAKSPPETVKPDPADRLPMSIGTAVPMDIGIATALTRGEPNAEQQPSRAPLPTQGGASGAQEQAPTDIEGEGVAVARGGQPAARGTAGDVGTERRAEKPIPSDVAQASIAKGAAFIEPGTAGKSGEFTQAVDFFREGTLGTDSKGRQTWTHPLRGGKKPVVLDEHKRNVMQNAKFWFKSPDALGYKKETVETVRKLVVELYGTAPPSQKPLKHGVPRRSPKKLVAGTFGSIAKGQRLPAKTVVDALFKAAFPSDRGQGQGSPWTENVLLTAADVTATDGKSAIVVDGDFAEDYAALAAKHPKEVRHLGGTGSKQAWKGSVFKETKQTATTRSSGIQVMNKNMLVAEDVSHFGDLRSLIEDYGGLTSRVEFPIQDLRRGLFVVKPMFPVKQNAKGEEEAVTIVVLVRNPDDSIGVYTANPEVGIAEHNVHEGGELLLTINAEYLDQALRLMQQHGHDMAVMHYGGHDKPLKITTRDNSIQSLTQRVQSDDRGIWGSARRVTKPGLYQLEVNDELQRAENRHGYTYEAARAAGLRPAFLGAGSAEPIFTKGEASGSLVTGLAPEHLQERGQVDERAARGLTFGFVDSEGRWLDAMHMDSAIRAATPIAEIAKQAGASAGFDPGNPKQYQAFEVWMERLDRYGDLNWNDPLEAEKLERNLRRAYNRLGKAVGNAPEGHPLMRPAPDKGGWPKPQHFEHRDWQRLRLKVADIQLDKLRAEGIAPQEPPGGPPRPTHAQAMQALSNAVTASARIEIEKQAGGKAEAHRALTKLVEKRSTKGISYFGAGPAPGADPTPVIYDRLATWIQNTPYGSRRQLLIDTLGRGFYGTYWRMPTDVWRPFERVKGAKKRAEAQAGTLAKRINAVVARRRLDNPDRVEWWVYGMEHTDDKPAVQKFKDHGAAITALHRAQAEYRRAVRGFPDEAVSADFRRPHMDETVEATFHAELKQVVEGTMDPADLEPEGRAIYDAYAPMVTEGTDWLLNNKWTWQYLKRFGLNNIEEIIRARREGPGVYLRRLYRRPLGVRPSRFEPDKAFDDRQIGPRIQGGMFKFRRGFDSGEVWTVRMADGTHNQFFDEGEAWEAWDAEIKANELEFGLSVFERVRLLDPLDATGLSLLEPIEDIRVLMAQTLVTQANNIATLKLFKFLADNFGTHSPAVGTVLLDGSPALGPLSDMYVPDHIARALAESIPIARNRVWMLWKAQHSAFKISHVVYNPGTTGRNLLGLTWFLGLDKDRPSFQDVRDAVREMRDQGAHWRAMVEENEINVGWSRGEMDYFGTFMDTPGASPLRWAREVSEQIAARLPGKTRKVLAWASPKNVGRLYDLPDQIIKLASYMGKRRRHGYTHREAIDAVAAVYPNYDRVGKWAQRISRHPLGSPFVAFQDQAAKAWVRAMRDRKGPLFGMAALPGLMTALSMILIGIDDDEMEMINLAPQRQNGREAYFQPVLPWRAPDGRPYTLDLRWTFPGASDFRVSTGSGGIALGTDLLFSDPIVTAIYGLKYNRDDWTGRDIIRDQYNSTAWGRFWKRATFVFRKVAPLPSIATRGFGRLYDAAVSGDAGRFIAVMLKEVFGVSITKPFVRRSDAMRVIKEKLTKAEGAQAMGMLEIWNREFRRRTGPWADKPISPRAVIQSVRRQAIDKAKREALRK